MRPKELPEDLHHVFEMMIMLIMFHEKNASDSICKAKGRVDVVQIQMSFLQKRMNYFEYDLPIRREEATNTRE